MILYWVKAPVNVELLNIKFKLLLEKVIKIEEAVMNGSESSYNHLDLLLIESTAWTASTAPFFQANLALSYCTFNYMMCSHPDILQPSYAWSSLNQ